jgi:predicted nucleic acid-binding protein
MSTVFADTFYLLGVANPDDHAHDKCVEITAQLQRIVTTTAVLVEVADALATSRQRERVEDFIHNMQREPRINILPLTQELFDRGLQFYTRHSDKEWSLTDCISFVVMRDERITDALTGDRHFEQAGFKILLK